MTSCSKASTLNHEYPASQSNANALLCCIPTVHSLVNKVASRPLGLNPVTGDELDQNQPGVHVHPRMGECWLLAGS